MRATRSSRSAARAELAGLGQLDDPRLGRPVEAADRAERAAGDAGVEPSAPCGLAVAGRRDARGHGRAVLGPLGPPRSAGGTRGIATHRSIRSRRGPETRPA